MFNQRWHAGASLINENQFGKETGGYGHRGLINDFLATGTFPKIHDAVSDALTAHFGETPIPAAIDIGCSTGLLALRLHLQHNSPRVIGLEPQAHDVQAFAAALARPGMPVFTQQFVLDIRKLNSVVAFGDLARANGIRMVVARRVISELVVQYGDKQPGVTHQQNAHIIDHDRALLNDCFVGCGITYVVVQGRAFSSRSTHPVPNTDTEITFLQRGYEVVYRHKDVAIMKKKA